MITLDPDSLKKLSYGGQVPFGISTDTDAQTLICTKILRIIPGKRIVCKAVLRGADVIAKFFLDTVHSGRHIEREVQGLKAFNAAGIPTPQIIAELTIANSITVLVTEYLSNAKSPCSLLKLPAETNDSTEVLKQFFTLLAKFHKAGLAQNDLHLDNFLLKDNVLYAIDAANLKNTKLPLSTDAALDNLALFFSQFDQDYYSILLDALESYHNANPNIAIDRQEIIARAKAKRQKIWEKVSKKYFKNCTTIVRKSNCRQLILCKRNYYKNQFIDFLNNPDTFLEKSILLKDGNSSTVGVVEIEGCKYVVKRFNIKNFIKLIRRQLPPSRAQRNWLLGHLLIFNNFKTPEPIAMIEKRYGPFRTVGYIVTEFVNAPDVRLSLSEAEGNQTKQREITNCFVSTLKKLHTRKITHGDLKNTNFLCADGELYIVDLDAMKLHKSRLTLERAIQRDCQRLVQNYHDNKMLMIMAEQILNII
jgi:tRNA A-37 threonylcarbamoyl transferase component Bud32